MKPGWSKAGFVSSSPLTDSNRRPPPYHGGALPTELRGRCSSVALVELERCFELSHRVQGGGFEPPKAEPAGLQPAPFGHSGIPAGRAIVAAVPGAAYHRGVERFDVLVVGAGPAGSATAIHLARGEPGCSSSTRRASRATSRAAAGSPAALSSTFPATSSPSSSGSSIGWSSAPATAGRSRGRARARSSR